MLFKTTPLKDVYLIELEKREDERGFFARFFCSTEFANQQLPKSFVQINNSLSHHKGTLRGMHYQLAPKAETKVVRCIQGSLYDVVIDLRPHSPTYKKSFGTVLSASNRSMMLVPEGFAHGFLTLEDNTEALYLVTEYYASNLERGIRWNDPSFKIDWPSAPLIISDKDTKHPDFNPSYHLSPTS